MYKNNKLSKAVRLAIAFGTASAMAFSGFALANQEEETSASAEDALAAVEEAAVERISVTGSRLRRAEFSEASPVQVVSGDIQRDMGIIDAASMLQNTSQASGMQIDSTFGGFVLDNGPGSATIGFRGLGAERTLVLINGRRMAPAGVGGAPTSPDLNLIPGVMIDRIENLYDGASTVYGSDAVAGVANVILKKDVDGLDLYSSYRVPKGEGGQELVLSGMYGNTYDNGFFTVGFEYSDIKRTTRGGYDFARGCNERMAETEDGRVITRYSGLGPLPRGYDADTCNIFPLTNRVQFPDTFWGVTYYTPGSTNIGIPDFTRQSVALSLAGFMPNWIAADSTGDGVNDITIIDGNGDGFIDLDLGDPFYSFQNSDYYRSGDYFSAQRRISVLLNGEHSLGDANDTMFYYEGLYAKRESPQFSPGAQFFPWVSEENHFNPCGVHGINCMGGIGLDWGPSRARPIINIRGDRDRHEIEVSQYRLVGGVTANLFALEKFGLENAYYDLYVSHSASKGDDRRQGIHSERLEQSLNTVMADDGSIQCADTSGGCVPVNLFAPNIYQLGGGTLTDAEASFLFAPRTMRTEVSQSVVNGFIGADLFDMPTSDWPVAAVFGAEFRRDEIKTIANDVATEGLLMFYFSDKGADGSRNLREAFTEIEFPVLRGQQFAHELTLTAAGRISDESFYDAASTYSLKAVYRPVDWFTVRGTKGTSYRAPSLRERFLNGTTGFGSVSDPCVVPDSARVSDPLNPSAPLSYDESQDNRDARVLTACIADGLDPTSLGLGLDGSARFTSLNSTEQVQGGSIQLSEETSVAKTFGFIFEQPFTDSFDLTFAMTKFDIEVSNSIAQPSAAYSVGQCYNTAGDWNPSFCDRLQRNSDGRIDLVDRSFINIGLITSKGWDYNLYAEKEFVVGSKNLRLFMDVNATQMKEQNIDVFGTLTEYVGRPTTPEWRGAAQFGARYGDLRFSWRTQFIGGAEGRTGPGRGEEPEFVDNNVSCEGLLNAAGDPLLCRPVWKTKDYLVHYASVAYSKDNYTITAGLRNVFNDAPPRVDQAGIFSANNIPLGVGYENPRSVFVNFSINL